MKTTTPQQVPRGDLERYAVFLFGIVFLISILVLVVAIPKPTPAQFFAFRLTLALAASGIGALIPGLIHLQQTLPHQGMIRFGGAIGLFATIWFTNPAKFAIDGIAPPPIEDARKYIERFLSTSDHGNSRDAYAMFSDKEQATIPFDSYTQLLQNVRAPLKERSAGPYLWNSSNPDEIPGRKGPFVFHAYQSRFKGKPGVWVEVAGAIAENGEWKMHTYTIQPCMPPICMPLDALAGNY
ncbi:hypothetical protein [Aquabacterium sp.]|uniref:hypothetical protein n=1 Tax=Aquabacterium sp. TaxID=1872578 RepID=UPI002E30C2CF|nr:hypothetical protein [Aquabacterium sp.]HEX5312285.1 hypothetical protein [Aquabacterium sp.]